MSQNTELIALCPESGPKLPASACQPHTETGPGETSWENGALGATLSSAPPAAVSERAQALLSPYKGSCLLPEPGAWRERFFHLLTI